MTYYSQHGEDFLLDQIFKDQQRGVFVEVGCIDGRRFSNTLAFEERGWKGLCVEAHAGYIELLKKNRPNSIVCFCAAGEEDEDGVPFYANARGSLSTLDKSQEGRWKRDYRDYFTGFELQQVKKRRLDTLFQQHGMERIDILSIDVEGYEVEVLKGIDFSRYMPSVIVVESHSPEHEQQLDEVLGPAGYHKLAQLSGNIFYSPDRALADHIDNKLFRGVELVHSAHPIDRTQDKIVLTDIDTRRPPSAGRLTRWLAGFQRKKPAGVQRSFDFCPTGFHGDRYLMELAGSCLEHVEQFIETGANVGSTLCYVATRYPHLHAYSCEPDKEAFEHARKNAALCRNVRLFNTTSIAMLKGLVKDDPAFIKRDTVFWLDAHGYGFQWPLREEVAFITARFTRGYMFIDDFQVPGLKEFKWDKYEGQSCSFDYIKDAITPACSYSLYYPAYREKTSRHHPLVGWGLIEFGHGEKLGLPSTLQGKIAGPITVK